MFTERRIFRLRERDIKEMVFIMYLHERLMLNHREGEGKQMVIGGFWRDDEFHPRYLVFVPFNNFYVLESRVDTG